MRPSEALALHIDEVSAFIARYDQIDELIVWTTVTQSIPRFVAVTRRIIAERGVGQG
jgi:hypothetical protein